MIIILFCRERKKIKEVEDYLKRLKVTVQRLPVTQGFHSSKMDEASGYYKNYLQSFTFDTPKIPFFSSLYGRQTNSIPQDYFWQVIRKPIRFAEAVESLRSFHESAVYVDLGSSGDMVNTLKKLISSSSNNRFIALVTPFIQNCAQLDSLVLIHKNERLGKEINLKEENKMLGYIFPGQGSQKKGMGAELFDQFPDIIRQADAILGYSICDLCTQDRNNLLRQTQYTQPALYIVNALMYMQAAQKGKYPHIVAGHSLGEYNALFAAGVFDFATGLKLVQKRGELMSQTSGGAMAAILGLNEEECAEVLNRVPSHTISIANYNSAKQYVISGTQADINRAQPYFDEIENITYIPLNVSGAFHSQYMSEAKQEFGKFIQQFSFSEPSLPVISNLKARPYRLSEIAFNLIEQITHPVKWSETVRVMQGFGDISLVEIGPGHVLTGLANRIQQEFDPIRLSSEEWAWQETKTAAPLQPSSSVKTSGAEKLGSDEFKQDYNLKYAYLSGGMYRGIASKELVIKMGKAGMMGFLGTGGLTPEKIEEDIKYIKQALNQGQAFGMNLLHTPDKPEKEEQNVELFMKYGVKNIEAAAYIGVTPALIKFRAMGLSELPDGTVVVNNRIIAKVSRPEVAQNFLSPAPEQLLEKMLKTGAISHQQAKWLREIPVADDLCLEADSAGHTDGGVAYVLMPAISKLREEMMEKYKYRKKPSIGAAGGIGTPEAAAAAFLMGADFIVTGSINQCTVESCTSDAVKDLLQQINIQDTAYAPAGDMFELGARVQVLKKGVFFPARANKLYELYVQHCSIDEIDEKTKKQLQERYFKKSFEDVYAEVKQYYDQAEIEKAELNSKRKMALIFKWYFAYSSRAAIEGIAGCQVDYQIHCGPALGAFNQWVKGTELEEWRYRHVDEIALKLLAGTVKLLQLNARKEWGS
ncbi:ACP S-malonyltransferase [Paenibacillus polymyxa]|uniref:ACP S-malonyltransferase n=1 Tax=Paenibacillus polymyxa TaxID=1406 RepID=UPI001F17783A|nr:ACP S-malonyltransferase [Paenibacillus polymyxa]